MPACHKISTRYSTLAVTPWLSYLLRPNNSSKRLSRCIPLMLLCLSDTPILKENLSWLCRPPFSFVHLRPIHHLQLIGSNQILPPPGKNFRGPPSGKNAGLMGVDLRTMSHQYGVRRPSVLSSIDLMAVQLGKPQKDWQGKSRRIIGRNSFTWPTDRFQKEPQCPLFWPPLPC